MPGTPAAVARITAAAITQNRGMVIDAGHDLHLGAAGQERSRSIEEEGYPKVAFWDCVSNWGLGEEFIAYGYPEEVNTAGAATAQARVFVGHYQRFFDFESPSNFRYFAGEMSVPAPGGHSGGPVFRRGAPTMLTGMVTSSHDSFTIIDSVEEINDDGRVLRVELHKVVSYGIALMLSALKPWLKGNWSSLKERGRVKWGPGLGFCDFGSRGWACVTSVPCFPAAANVCGERPGRSRTGREPGRRGRRRRRP